MWISVLNKLLTVLFFGFVLFFCGFVYGREQPITIAPDYEEEMMPVRGCAYVLKECMNDPKSCKRKSER